jgi:hypothetical protein
MSWLTRWLMGALDPTHGQAVEVADAGRAPAPSTRLAATKAKANPLLRAIVALDSLTVDFTVSPDGARL